MIFSFIYCRVLRGVAHEGKQSGFGLQVPYSGVAGPWKPTGGHAWTTVDFSDVTWADDSTFVTMGRDCFALERQVGSLATSILTSCAKHGLVANMKCGKTTAVLAMRGKGQKEVSRRMFPGNRKTFPVALADGRTVDLHAQPQYIHLGGVVTGRHP